jgi:hypothetical protein
MAKIPESFQSALKKNPSAVFRLIARVKDDPDAHVESLKARGFIVHRTFALISALAIEGAASSALALADEPWVLSIEEDKLVHTM